ncbi:MULTISPECIES: aminoacyl-tRNA hydrolase [unclassified Spirosoma]|uniref:aminoacyl-tRNA hydrolase n=1 Tax=unclassified Spirosoma TaxID=2621999 RepID=UPI00095CD3F2|nr:MULTISPECIES: aminoacyl-tRNA hydrolase [unclassified Spirosoma]MBN8821896.1 aminoacyl-tRNA hydrolase [Spirosoma sp.]OJW80895.1 MAG: aminoacyl-tRNA hydrolase [Spirosoma sp. 48-14]
MKFLLVGLGNIGPEYALTRHNAGFMVLDRLATQHGFSFSMTRLAYTAQWQYKGKQLFFVKPTTYMNLSGKAVNYYLKQEKIPVENLLVITDDKDLPFGKLRLKPKGSPGGHNGLRNIDEILATQEYARLRVGIGNNFSKGRQVDFVLGQFPEDELIQLPDYLDRAGDAILSFCTLGIQATMNNYNQ